MSIFNYKQIGNFMPFELGSIIFIGSNLYAEQGYGICNFNRVIPFLVSH